MILSDSRASSGLKEHLRSTKGSSLFNRAVGRETKPAWGNRIVKDFYDLDYNPRSDRFANAFRSSQVTKQNRLAADLRKRKISRKQSRQDIATPTKTPIRMTRSLHYPERIQISTIETTSAKHHGLSPFEYSNTIQGRIERKASHHLSFDKNKVNRINNELPIYYDRHREIDFSSSRSVKQRQQLGKYHPFPSYIDRRVFEPRDQLDKFYDTDNARTVASPRRQPQAIRRFERVLERRDAKLNQSVGLSYQTVPCLSLTERKAESYSIQPTPRDIVFGHEVIDPSRGCYR